GGDDAGVVHDVLAVEGNVVVHPAKYQAALQILEVGEGEFGHGRRASAGQARQEVAHPAGVAPLVVVPGDDLDAPAADDAGQFGIDDRGTLVTAEIGGHQLLVLDPEKAFHRPGGGRFQSLVHRLR